MGFFSGGIFFVFLCIVVGYYASTLNRTGFGWTLISLVITPFLASMLLLIFGDPTKPKEIK